MTNETIYTLASAGLTSLDYAGLSPDNAYKVYRFTRDLSKAFKELNEQRAELIEKALTKEEREQATKLEQEGKQGSPEHAALAAKVQPLLAELFKQEQAFEVRKISAATYFALKAANRELLSNAIDAQLEGVLWEDNEQE